MERARPQFTDAFFEKAKALEEEREKLTLPAVEIKNEVVKTNPAFKEAPFDIRRGKPMKLAAFFTPAPEREEKTYRLSLLPEPTTHHTRAGQWGSVIFRDAEGRIYRDVDVKGVGMARTDIIDSLPYVDRVSIDWGGTRRHLGFSTIAMRRAIGCGPKNCSRMVSVRIGYWVLRCLKKLLMRKAGA